MSDQPLVSLIIPVYNGSAFLAQAIDSALAQTYANIEIIVVNDGSTDQGQSERIARSYGDRIRYLEKTNGGVGDALNLAIQHARGDFFSWLSHDDLYYPEKVQAQVDYAGQIGYDAIVYSDFEFIDESGASLGERRLPHYSPEQFRASFMLYHTINGCALLIPMKCFKTVGMFDTSLRTTQDYALWFQFSFQYEFHHLPGLLVKSRQHTGQDTNRMPERVVRENNALFSQIIKSLTVTDVTALNDGSVALYFARVMRMMLHFGYSDAWNVARTRTISHVTGLRVLEIPEFFNIFVYTILVRVYRMIKQIIKRPA